MAHQRQHTWLSQARREAERQAARRATVLGRLRRSAGEASTILGEWAGGAGGILFTLLLLVFIHVVFLVIPEIPGVPDADDGRDFLSSLWQVSAALIGIAFVLLILIVETIHRSVQGEYLWQRFARSSGLFMITAFLLGTILAIGAGALWLLPSTGDGLGASSRLTNLVAVDILLFALSLVALLWLYVNVFRFLNPAFVQHLATESLLATVRTAVSKTLLSRVEDYILRQECEALGFLYDRGATHWGRMEPVRIDTEGTVTNVNLRELKKLARLLPHTLQPSAVVALGVGQLVARDREAAIFVRHDAFSEEVSSQVRRCFKIAPGRPERVRDLREIFSFLTEQAFTAIESGRQERFRGVLDALREPMRVALETLRSYGVVFDPEAARNIFPFEWPALERPFREYERIVEAAARSGDRNIVLEAAYWPYRVMSLAIEERDHFFYAEAVRYLPYLYRLSQADASPRAKELLRHRAWTHLKDFGLYEITARLRSTGDAQFVASLKSYADVLLSSFTGLLRRAIDTGDEAYFLEASRGFWEAIDTGFVSHELGLSLDGAYLEQQIGSLEGLDKAKADFLLHVADRRDALWFALGGWVCHRWATSRMPPDLARATFRRLAEAFGDFKRLWRTFNSALSSESAERLPLSEWEMGEHPEGEAVWLRPEAHIALFFTVVALTNIPDRVHERLHTLVVPMQASWAKTQVTAALEEVRANPGRWEPFIGDTNRPDQESAIIALMDAAEAEENRRERLQIMDQELSPSKLSEFKTEFLAAWVQDGLLRRLLHDVGAIEYSHREPSGTPILGLWKMVSKGAFVEETGSTHWIDTGRSFGTGFAAGENDKISEAIRKRAPLFKLGARKVAKKLSEVLRRLTDAGYVPDVILFTGHYQILRSLEQSDEYVPFYASPGDRPASFWGTFEDVPIYMCGGGDESEFVVVSLKSIGRLVQYLTDDDSLFRKFEIEGYSVESAKEAAAGDRSWLPEDVRSRPDDAVIEYLREHVSVRIEEAFEMRIDDKAAARRLIVPPP